MAEQVSLVVQPLPEGGEILANFDELGAYIETLIADYKDLEVTESYVTQAKRDMAYLNTLAGSLDAERKRVKQTVMQPVTAFESRIKELIAPITDARAGIERQVKEYEARRKDEKRARLRAHWLDYAGILADAVPFERILDERWLNASFHEGNALKAITDLVEKAARDEEALTGLNLPYADEAKATFLATLDMGAAIERNRVLVESAERAAAFEAEKAAIIAARDAANAEEPTEDTTATDTTAETASEDVPRVMVHHITTEDAPRGVWEFTVGNATRADVEKVMDFAKSLGLTGGRARKVTS